MRDRVSFYILTATIIVAGQLALLALDADLQFALGDSKAYIGVIDGYRPLDRQPALGLLLRRLLKTFGTMQSLVWLHVGAFSLSCFALLWLLREHLGAHRLAAVITTLIASVLPAHVLWTRYVMTETIALLCVMAMLVAACEYLRSKRWWWLVLTQIAGVCGVAFRLALIPPVLGLAVGLPLLLMLIDRRRVPGLHLLRRAIVHLLISVLAAALLHGAYQDQNGRSHWRGRMLPAAYAYEGGLFRLGFVVPIVQACDFPADVDGAALLQSVGYDLRDPRMRNHHRFGPEGLIIRIREATATEPDWSKRVLWIDRIGGTTASNAVRRDPVGVLRLALSTLLDFFDPAYFRHRMREEIGFGRGEEPRFSATMQRYGIDARQRIDAETPLKRAFLASQPWFAALAFVSVLLPLALWFRHREHLPQYLLICSLILYFNLVCAFLAMLPSARFMHPMSFLVCAAVGGFVRKQSDSPAAGHNEGPCATSA